MFNIDTRSVSFNIVVVNVLFFIATLIGGNRTVELFGLFYPASPLFKPLQLVTYMFMHGGFMHLLMNMFSVIMIGPMLEYIWGPQKFLIYYFSTAFGAIILHLGVDAVIINNLTGSIAPSLSVLDQLGLENLYRTPIVGASGAVFGLITAAAILLPYNKIIIPPFFFPINIRVYAMVYVSLEIFYAFAALPGDNIAHFAHLGGALFGYIIVTLWRNNHFNQH